MKQGQNQNSYYSKIKILLRKLFIENRQEPINTETNLDIKQAATQQEFNDKTIAEQKKANNISEIANEIAKENNRLSKTSTIVNAILLVFTLVAIFISGISTYIANQALKQADLAFEEQRKINLRSKEDKITDDTATVRRRRYTDSISNLERQITFASIKSSDSISKATLQQQIQFLKETKEEFENEHQSFLNVNPYIDVEKFIKTRRLNDAYDFNVIGNQPIKIDSVGIRTHFEWDSGFNSRFSPDSMNIEAEYNKYGYQMDNQPYYVVTEHPVKNLKNPYSMFGIPSDYFSTILSKKRIVLLIGKVYYTNLVTNIHFIYKYLLAIEFDFVNKEYNYVVLYNKNEKNNSLNK